MSERPKEEWVKLLPVGRSLHEVKCEFIMATLHYFEGNRTHSAKALKMSLTNLKNRIEELRGLGYKVPPNQSTNPRWASK